MRGPGAPADATASRSPVHPVAADPDRLAQLLANLIENALTFARTRSPWLARRPRVGRLRHHGRRRRTGHRRRATWPGCSSGSTGPTGAEPTMGSGLGLAIVAELAAAMGGDGASGVAGLGGRGSRFVVTLRRWPDERRPFATPAPVLGV